MIKRNQVSLNRLNAFSDFLLVMISYILASWLRLYVFNGVRDNMALDRKMVLAAGIYALGLLFVLAITGFYSTTRMRRLSWRLKVLFAALTVSVLAASSLLYVFRLEEFSRGVLAIFYFLALLLLGGKYVIGQRLLDQLRTQGYNTRCEVVIGSGALAMQYCEDVKLEPELGLNVEAVLDPVDDEAIEAELARPGLDEVVIALEDWEYRHITRLISICEKNGVKYLVIPFYNNLIPAHPVIESVGRSKLINMRTNRLEEIGWAMLKRGFDLGVSIVGMLLLSPLLAAIALGVKLSSPGPVLFRQTRVGYNRQEFEMLKFRSMRVNDAQNTAWSTATDDRRTAFGAFIRKTSLDELPQLWNVIRGDMSLVGPRPELPYFVERFKETIPLYMVKHQVKPGITGWAQVNGYRGDTSIRKRVKLDLWYIDNWSPWLDLKILFMTVTGGMVNNERIKRGGDADVKIIVCTHKSFWMPPDRMYVPLQVGAEGGRPLGYTTDDTGENISARDSFGELTGLYWAWKNLKSEYLGLAHYRRHFTLRRTGATRRNVLTLDQAQPLLEEADALVPAARSYGLAGSYSQYAHDYRAGDLDATREIIAQRCPRYLDAFDRCMKRTAGHRYNMFIMKRELADAYCEWLFDVLLTLEARLKDAGRGAAETGLFAQVGERLLDVWLETNSVKCRELPCIVMEKDNWFTRSAAKIKKRLEAA